MPDFSGRPGLKAELARRSMTLAQARQELAERTNVSPGQRQRMQWELDAKAAEYAKMGQAEVEQLTTYVYDKETELSEGYEAVAQDARALKQSAYLSQLDEREARKQVDRLIREEQRLTRLTESVESARQRRNGIKQDPAGYIDGLASRYPVLEPPRWEHFG